MTDFQQIHHSNIALSGSSSLSEATESQNPVKLLGDLLKKVIESPENGAVEFSPDVIRAAVDLNRALQPAPPPESIACLINAPSSKTHHNSGDLPLLPSIMDNKLERAVFTHPGVGRDPKTSYDRLEILGDAYIELMATKLIWDKFQEIPSGRISQIRELLVKNETLAEYATKYGLDRRALVPQEYLNQPKRWIKTRGDLFEAYVAAVILSNPNGYAVAENWLSQLWMPKLNSLSTSESDLHAKESLAKKIMGKGVKLKYIDEKPPKQHEGGMQTFFIGVYLTGWGWENKHLGSGQGSNKTIAGNKAARQALQNQDLINSIIDVKRAHEGGRP
ncbi:hypothetical protein ARAM_000735 [Aspergillus rambellii]|uniref:RNase III domain-containing protein n=2 Tax=Aspergillus subgen. Nidulantes TaxID=2720870 RepID=A0A0F8U925_9EURO|nr:hypothetical protein ARAM_000735 [Aspergillus rambellii]KKK16541.1 hypothetical protein AOCH_002587 [Aspergillus ochraceoroseus]